MTSRLATTFPFASGLALSLGILGGPLSAAAECEPPEIVIGSAAIGGLYGYCGAIDAQKTAWLQTIPNAIFRRRWEQPYDESRDAFGAPNPPGLSSTVSVGLDIDELGFPVVSSGGASRLEIQDEPEGTTWVWRHLIFKPAFIGGVPNTAGLPNKFSGSCTPIPGYPCIGGPSWAVRARGGRVYVAESSGNVFEATLNPNRTVNAVREIANYLDAPPSTPEFYPKALDVDEAGGVYVGGTTATLFVPPPDANGVRSAPVEQLPGHGLGAEDPLLGGIAVDAQGRVFVVSVEPGPLVRDGELWMFSRDANGQWVCGAIENGECAPIYREQPGDDVVFRDPNNVAIDEAGVLYVVAKGNTWDSSLIRMKVAADGSVDATTLLKAPEVALPGVDDFLYGLGVGVNRKGTLVYGATEGHEVWVGEPPVQVLEDNGLWQVYLDSDDDDVCDYEDNCLDVANGPGNGSNQIDTDGDGFGNACDADYTQEGVVGAPDLAIIYRAFGTSNEPVTDFNGDGVTGTADLLFIAPQVGGPAKGRSGLDCADRTICIAGNSHCASGPDPACPFSW